VNFHAPTAGSKSSALERKNWPKPPAARIFPLRNNVAEAPSRGFCMAPVGCQIPLAGSYSSELLTSSSNPLNPPATSTFPLASETPNWPSRESDKLPVAFQFLAELS